MSRIGDNYLQMAESYKKLVFARTKISPQELICPNEQSDMTPCIARDGKLSCSEDGVCVGCEKRVVDLLTKENNKREEEDPKL